MSTEECKVNWGSGCFAHNGGKHHCANGFLHDGKHTCFCGADKPK